MSPILTKYALPVVASLSTFLLPIKGLLLMMVLAISIDTVLGIYAAVKNGGWRAFTSTKLFNIVTKSFFYLVSIILAFCVDTYIVGGSIMSIPLFFAKTITCVFLYIEVKSIDETSVTKLGNKSLWTLLKELITKVKDVKKDLNDVVEKKKDDETPEAGEETPSNT